MGRSSIATRFARDIRNAETKESSVKQRDIPQAERRSAMRSEEAPTEHVALPECLGCQQYQSELEISPIDELDRRHRF